MSYPGLLDHRVQVVRMAATGATDEYGRAVTAQVVVGTVRAAIQAKSAREVAALHEAGAALTDHTIFMEPAAGASTADALVHDPALCPKAPHDLPTGRYELSSVRNAVGRGHHIEADARLVGPSASSS